MLYLVIWTDIGNIYYTENNTRMLRPSWQLVDSAFQIDLKLRQKQHATMLTWYGGLDLYMGLCIWYESVMGLWRRSNLQHHFTPSGAFNYLPLLDLANTYLPPLSQWHVSPHVSMTCGFSDKKLIVTSKCGKWLNISTPSPFQSYASRITSSDRISHLLQTWKWIYLIF